MRLNITDVRPEDFGEYECVSKNEINTTAATFHVYGDLNREREEKKYMPFCHFQLNCSDKKFNRMKKNSRKCHFLQNLQMVHVIQRVHIPKLPYLVRYRPNQYRIMNFVHRQIVHSQIVMNIDAIMRTFITILKSGSYTSEIYDFPVLQIEHLVSKQCVLHILPFYIELTSFDGGN